MKLDTHKIGTRLFLGFGTIMFLTLILGIISIIQIEITADKTSKLYNHPLKVSNNVRDIKATIIAIHRSMKDVALAKNKKQILENSKLVNENEKLVYEHFEIVFEQFLGDKKDVEQAYEAFKDWKIIRDKVIQLSLKGDMLAAAEITKGKGARHVKLMTKKIQIMIDFANNKADSFLKNAMDAKAQHLVQLTVFILLIVITGTIITMISTKGITTPLSEVVKGLEAISTGNLTTTISSEREDEIGILVKSYKRMQSNLKQVVDHAKVIAGGNYTEIIEPTSDKDELSFSLNHMTNSLNDLSKKNYWQTWIQSGQNGLNEVMRGELDSATMANNITTYLAEYLDAQVGAFYAADENRKKLILTGSYAYPWQESFEKSIGFGQGIIGQVALKKEKLILTEIPENYIRITSALGSALPKNILVFPVLLNEQVIAVIELGSLKEFDEHQIEFIEMSVENIAINMNSAFSRTRLNSLLEKTQEQQIQLQNSNSELEEQTKKLRLSETELKLQQEELQTTNEELEEKTLYLTKQKEQIQIKNNELEEIKLQLEQKAKELEITSKYKSEFLANMSHELRTPLNSLLILSEDLSENRSGNLDEEQIEFAEIIYKSGKDLLLLINEILDLAKIEAGKMNLNFDKIIIEDFINRLVKDFSPLVFEKNLKLLAEIDDSIPKYIISDPVRSNQIMRNLISNAVKFTEKGSVSIKVGKPSEKTKFENKHLNKKNTIAFSVIDTGIGVPKDKQLIIFEAFQQIDVGTSRKYTGTGLGLSITRELVKILGGEIHLKSKKGKGSDFTIFLPAKFNNTTACLDEDNSENTLDKNKKEIIVSSSNDKNIQFQKQKILIVDDDMRNVYAISKVLENKGLETIKAANGKMALDILNTNEDINIVLMDIMMPVMNGYKTIEQIRSKEKYKNIPIIALTAKAMKDDCEKCITSGANDYISKPVDVDKLISLIKKWLYEYEPQT